MRGAHPLWNPDHDPLHTLSHPFMTWVDLNQFQLGKLQGAELKIAVFIYLRSDTTEVGLG